METVIEMAKKAAQAITSIQTLILQISGYLNDDDYDEETRFLKIIEIKTERKEEEEEQILPGWCDDRTTIDHYCWNDTNYNRLYTTASKRTR